MDFLFYFTNFSWRISLFDWVKGKKERGWVNGIERRDGEKCTLTLEPLVVEERGERGGGWRENQCYLHEGQSRWVRGEGEETLKHIYSMGEGRGEGD